MSERKEMSRRALEKLKAIEVNPNWCEVFENEAKQILTNSLDPIREEFYGNITPCDHLSSITAFPKIPKEEIERLEINKGRYYAAEKLLDKVFCYDGAIFQLLKSMVKLDQLYYVHNLMGKIREKAPHITPINEMSENSVAQPVDLASMDYRGATSSNSVPPFSASNNADRRIRRVSANSVFRSVDQSVLAQGPAGELSVQQPADQELARLRVENERLRNYIASTEGGLERYLKHNA